MPRAGAEQRPRRGPKRRPHPLRPGLGPDLAAAHQRVAPRRIVGVVADLEQRRLDLGEPVQRAPADRPGERLHRPVADLGIAGPHPLEATLRRQPGRDLPVTALFALERLGWERGRAHDGGLVTDWVRRAEGLSVTLTVEPGLFVGDPLLNDVQHVVDVALESSGPVPPRLASELQRELLGR